MNHSDRSVTMDRRSFCGLAGSGAAGSLVLPMVEGGDPNAVQERRRYEYSIVIVEGPEDGCGFGHKPADVLRYPEQKGRICPWLMDSMNGFLRVLEYGGSMTWMYRGTPYEKTVDPGGVTTEFVRCPDPTSGLVAKIVRTRVP
jgi:uncharacterized repeat protein (TIGR04076 family)